MEACPRCGETGAPALQLPQGFLCRRCGAPYGITPGDDGASAEEIEYLRFFREAIFHGYRIGDTHPVEIAASLYRSQSRGGGRLHYCLARYLCDMFVAEFSGRPETAEDVLLWCDAHYAADHPAHGSLRFLESHIARALRDL